MIFKVFICSHSINTTNICNFEIGSSNEHIFDNLSELYLDYNNMLLEIKLHVWNDVTSNVMGSEEAKNEKSSAHLHFPEIFYRKWLNHELIAYIIKG